MYPSTFMSYIKWLLHGSINPSYLHWIQIRRGEEGMSPTFISSQKLFRSKGYAEAIRIRDLDSSI